MSRIYLICSFASLLGACSGHSLPYKSVSSKMSCELATRPPHPRPLSLQRRGDQLRYIDLNRPPSDVECQWKRDPQVKGSSITGA